MIQQSEFLKPIDFDEQFFAVDQLSILCPDGTYQSDCTGHEGVLSKRQEFINKVWCQYYNNPPYINIGSPIYDGKDFNFFSKAENVTDYEFAVAKQYCDEQNQKQPEFLKPIDFDEQFFAIDPISPIDEFVYLGEVSYFGERLCPDGTMQPYKSSSEQSDCIGHEAPKSISISYLRCPDGVTFGIDEADCRSKYPPDPTDPLVPVARLGEVARECADGTLIVTYKVEDEQGLRYSKGVLEYKSKACGYKPAERDSGSVTWCENGNLVGDFTDGMGGMYRKIAEYGAPNCVDTIGSKSLADLKLENLLKYDYDKRFDDRFNYRGGGMSGNPPLDLDPIDPLPYDYSSSETSKSDKMHQKMYQTYDPIYTLKSGVAIEELGGIQPNDELQLQKLKLELEALKNPITSEVTPMVKIAPKEVNTPIVPMSDSIDTKSLGIALGLGLVVWYLLSNKKY